MKTFNKLKKTKVAELMDKEHDLSPWDVINDSVYVNYESYVHSSDLNLFKVISVGRLHFNVYKSTGKVERCNRMIRLRSFFGNQEINYFAYLCDNDALNPPKERQIIDAKLDFIDLDENGEYYWVKSFTIIDKDVEFNFIEDYDINYF